MNEKKTAVDVLCAAAKNNIVGKLLRKKRNGREVREYTINGEKFSVEGWHTEHTTEDDIVL